MDFGADGAKKNHTKKFCLCPVFRYGTRNIGQYNPNHAPRRPQRRFPLHAGLCLIGPVGHPVNVAHFARW